jgi:uncharacterized pyridoxamine 5'-phosphate oxidase family protein
MNQNVEKFILNAPSKALATYGKYGLNVIPVSSLKVVEGEIWLINYFMDKTLENIKDKNEVALVCWNKMFGYQIKGEIEYFENGEKFTEAVNWIADILPDRTVKGLLILKPKEIFDIAPTKNTHEFRYDL